MALFALDALTHPIVQAPMGGGPSTTALAAAVSAGGGLGFLAAGYKRPHAVFADLAPTAVAADPRRALWSQHLRPARHGTGAGQVAGYAETLTSEAADNGVALGSPRWDDDHCADKLALLCEEHVPVASFTFGCPSWNAVERLHHAGVAVWVTVTTPEEAGAAGAVGADALVAMSGSRRAPRRLRRRGAWGLGVAGPAAAGPCAPSATHSRWSPPAAWRLAVPSPPSWQPALRPPIWALPSSSARDGQLVVQRHGGVTVTGVEGDMRSTSSSGQGSLCCCWSSREASRSASAS